MIKFLIVAAVVVLTASTASVGVPTGDTPLCEWCKAGIRENKIIMHDTCTLGELDLFQNWVCKNVPISNCDEFITTSRNKLTDWIDSWDEDYLCKRMQWCLKYEDSPRTALSYADPNPVAPEWCEYCHDVLGELKKVAHDPDVLIMNKDNPYIVCDIVDNIPGCLVTMKLFFKWGLETCQEIDVTKQCVKWNVCKEVDEEKPEKDEATGFCSVCENAVDFLKQEMDDPAVEENFQMAVEAVCKILPMENCQSYANVMKILLGSMDGKTLCSQAGVC